jgi:hypothetical protein
MKSLPILFSAPMVRALLAGQKTQTRRIMKPQPSADFFPTIGAYNKTLVDFDGDQYPSLVEGWGASDENECHPCRYGQPGDTLWVKETYRAAVGWNRSKPIEIPTGASIRYEADATVRGEISKIEVGRIRQSIYMRRWMSRLTLEIAAVRVERLQAITEADAINEGSQEPSLVPIIGACLSERDAYAKLWESINGPGSWGKNPWVWVITFKRISA